MAVEDYFSNSGTIAITVASCSFPVGVFLLPLITRALLDAYSFFGTFIILSALMLNCGVCGLLFKPLEKNVVHDSYKQMVNPTEPEGNKDVEAAADETFPSEEESEIDSEDSPGDENMKVNRPKRKRYKSFEETIIVPIGEPLRFGMATREEVTDESSGEDEPSPPAAEKVEEPEHEEKEIAETSDNVSAPPRVDEPVEVKKERKEKAKTFLHVIIGVDNGEICCDARIILYLIASVLFSMGFGIPLCFYPDVSREYGKSSKSYKPFIQP